MHRSVLWIAAAILGLAPLPEGGISRHALPAHAAPADEHPEVETWKSCEDCHAAETPEEFQEWLAGRHGLNNVKCVVCHGSVGEDFVLRPAPDRCQGCHGQKLDSMRAPFMKGKTCFSCHPPHRLNPHLTADQGGGR
jgi:hypothetical protein